MRLLHSSVGTLSQYCSLLIIGNIGVVQASWKSILDRFCGSVIQIVGTCLREEAIGRADIFRSRWDLSHRHARTRPLMNACVNIGIWAAINLVIDFILARIFKNTFLGSVVLLFFSQNSDEVTLLLEWVFVHSLVHGLLAEGRFQFGLQTVAIYLHQPVIRGWHVARIRIFPKRTRNLRSLLLGRQTCHRRPLIWLNTKLFQGNLLL